MLLRRPARPRGPPHRRWPAERPRRPHRRRSWGPRSTRFGTVALVAIGCDMARQCHLDTCPTGIATEREDLRAEVRRTPDESSRFFTAIAEDVAANWRSSGSLRRRDRRRAAGGCPTRRRSRTRAGAGHRCAAGAPARPAATEARVRRPRTSRSRSGWRPTSRRRSRPAGRSPSAAPHAVRRGLSVGRGRTGARRAAVERTTRSSGAPGRGRPVSAHLRAGSRCGSLARPTTTSARDCPAARSSIVPSAGRSPLRVGREAIAGNTCLYGATGGRLHLVGRAGMRFAVRNCGARRSSRGSARTAANT